ncbi:hypothetical protein C8R42DRAFT_672973, partial [Lentinula raphanica]
PQILCSNFALFSTVLFKFSLCLPPHSELPEVFGEHQNSLFLLPECPTELIEMGTGELLEIMPKFSPLYRTSVKNFPKFSLLGTSPLTVLSGVLAPP